MARRARRQLAGRGQPSADAGPGILQHIPLAAGARVPGAHAARHQVRDCQAGAPAGRAAARPLRLLLPLHLGGEQGQAPLLPLGLGLLLAVRECLCCCCCCCCVGASGAQVLAGTCTHPLTPPLPPVPLPPRLGAPARWTSARPGSPSPRWSSPSPSSLATPSGACWELSGLQAGVVGFKVWVQGGSSRRPACTHCAATSHPPHPLRPPRPPVPNAGMCSSR